MGFDAEHRQLVSQNTGELQFASLNLPLTLWISGRLAKYL